MKATGEMRAVLTSGLLILIALTTLAQGGGSPLSGLQITLSPEQAEAGQSKVPKFRVEFRNVGEDDLVLNVGLTLANGRKQYPNAVMLRLKDSQGESRLLNLREPALVAGRLDPLVVVLPVGSAFSIPVDIDKYWAGIFDHKLKPGTYSLEAQFTGRRVTPTTRDTQGIALMPYWEGTVTSNQLRFEVPRLNPAAPPGGTVPGLFQVHDIQVLATQSYPYRVTLKVEGSLPDSCTSVDRVSQMRSEHLVTVTITTKHRGEVCAQVVRTVTVTVPLDGSFESGEYQVSANGVEKPFRLA
jgi:hypothetical protein